MYKGMVVRTVLVIISDLALKNEYADSEVVLEGSADELEEKEVFLSREIQSTPWMSWNIFASELHLGMIAYNVHVHVYIYNHSGTCIIRHVYAVHSKRPAHHVSCMYVNEIISSTTAFLGN